MNKFGFPNLGFGLGLRAKHYDHILENKPNIDWFEIISENYMDSRGKPRAILEKIRADYPIVMHGVSLSIGSTDPLNEAYLKSLKNLANDIEPKWISDHLCWTGINGKNTHDLLPVPLTEESLDHVTERIKKVQDYLGRNILLENPSSYLTFRADHIAEYEFMAQMANKADCGLLLDVNNIYVASYNQRLDPYKYIDAIPMDRVVQIHLAGHENKGTHIVDTHEGEVIDEVWDLYKYAIKKAGFVPSTMVEWDAGIPEFPVVEAEINKAREFIKDEPQIIDYKNTEYKYQPSNHAVKDLQTYLQTAILDGDISNCEPATWIVPKENFPPEEQLAVYVTGYRLRLYDIIMDDYEVTKHYLADKMPGLVRSYIDSVPSEFYDVSKFSAQFADWLQEQDVDDFACELAELERFISICFNMPYSEPLRQEDLACADPEDFISMRLKPRDASILVSFENNVNEYLNGFYQSKNIKASQQKTYLAIYLNGNKVYRLELEEDEFKLLNFLDEGKNIGEAITALALTCNFSEAEMESKIQKWFGRWVSNEVLQKVTS